MLNLRVGENLGKIMQPAPYVLDVKIVSLAVDDTLDVADILGATGNGFVDDQVLGTAHANSLVRLQFVVYRSPHDFIFVAG